MKIIKTLLSVAILTAISNSASAAPIGTAAGTAIDNTAHISYKVGTVDQTDIYSSEDGNTIPGVPGTAGAPTVNATKTTFTVDKKIDLSVAKGSDVTVVPEEANKNITFTLQNEGNSTEYFKLEQSNVANGTGAGQDNFDPVASSCSIVTPTSPVQLTSGETTTVTVKCDIPVASANVADGKTASIDLKATAVVGSAANAATYQGTIGGDTAVNVAGSEDIVLADGDGAGTDASTRNAIHSAINNYNIVTANLKVKKTEAIVKMSLDLDDDNTTPLTDVTSNLYHIPGATIEYTITINNTGTADASNLIMSDPLPANMTYVSPNSCAVTGIAASATCDLSGANVVSTAFTLAGGETATLKFKAIVD